MATIQIRLADDLKKKLQEEADRRELSISDVTREKIKKGMGLPA